MSGPTATYIGRCFIAEYYKRLQKNPGQLRQLFHDGAEFSHALGDQEVTPVVGLDAISTEIENIGFNNARVDISNGSVDCQHSHDGGVVVMVCGLLTLNDEQEAQQFVQSFFLARVPPKSYAIRNSCLRLIGTPPQPAAAAVAEPASQPAPSAVDEVVEDDAVEAEIEIEKDTKPEAQEAQKTQAPAPAAVPAPEQEPAPVAAPEQEPQAEQPKPVKNGNVNPWSNNKQTIADLFKGSDGTVAPASAPALKPSKPAAHRPANGDAGAAGGENKATSLYVKGNLEGADEKALRKIFEPYGYIRGVNVKSGYAFVDYDSHEAVVHALEYHRTTPFKFNDKPLEVEQRSNSKSSRNFERGGPNAGRGGNYRSRGGRGGNPRRDRKDGGGNKDGRQRGDNRREKGVRRDQDSQ